jgi:integrase
MTGTISKRPLKNGEPRWAYSFFAGWIEKDGKRSRDQRTKSGFRTKREAQEALRKAIEERERTPAAQREIPTFAEFFERWHNEVVIRQHSPKTAERSHELAQYAIRLFGDTPLDKLTTEQLTSDMNRLADHGGCVTKQHPKGRPLSPKTVRHIAFGVQACLEQAVDWDILMKNPMKKVKKPKVPKRKPKIVDKVGFAALLRKTAGFAVYPVIMLGNATGIRRGELCALEWTDLDWDKGTIEVSKSLEETKQGLRVKSTKSGEPRKHPLSIPAEVLEVLREHKREQDHHRELYGPDYANLNLIFARPDGYYYNPDKLGRRIVAAMKSVGLSGVSLHSLRHTHTSELLSMGVPITAVAERLGHASPAITLSIYSHALPADNEAAAKLWNDAMADVIQESRKEAARKRMLANVSAADRKKSVIPIKSGS